MKKNYLKWSLLGASLFIAVFACSPENPELAQTEQELKAESISEMVAGSENFRTIPTSFNYFEEFENQLFYVPVIGLDYPQGLYPGTGLGSATRFGKGKTSMSFINQLATFDAQFNLNTVGAPVTDIFFDELTGLGLSNIPSEVSSLTTDGMGNAIWFENVENVTTPVGPDRINFTAKVKIIGGNGRFAKATGEGIVEGYFNPTTGEGKSSTTARINF